MHFVMVYTHSLVLSALYYMGCKVFVAVLFHLFIFVSQEWSTIQEIEAKRLLHFSGLNGRLFIPRLYLLAEHSTICHLLMISVTVGYVSTGSLSFL